MKQFYSLNSEVLFKHCFSYPSLLYTYDSLYLKKALFKNKVDFHLNFGHFFFKNLASTKSFF